MTEGVKFSLSIWTELIECLVAKSLQSHYSHLDMTVLLEIRL